MRHGVPSFVQREHVRIEQRARAVVIGDDVVDAEIGFGRAQRPRPATRAARSQDAGVVVEDLCGMQPGFERDDRVALRGSQRPVGLRMPGRRTVRLIGEVEA